ncbi:hypothetical protein CLAM6_12260 [Cobetia sp. AM6]|nr:hypothetical protein CLAM6_12260 [Cobetia sp. AM6]
MSGILRSQAGAAFADTSYVAGESLTRAAADTGSQTRKESPHHVLQDLDSYY